MTYIFFFYFLIILLLNFLFIKYDLMGSDTGLNHQVFVNKSVPLSGGIYILFPIFLIFYENYFFEILIFFSLFILGFLSDKDILRRAKLRFFLQLLIICFFVISIQLEVMPTRIDFIDDNFSNTYLSYFFSAFCLLILINGSNFIDGLNGLLIGYILLIFFILYKTNLLIFLDLQNQYLIFFICVLFLLIIMNFSNFLFLGDGGSYSLSFVLGIVLIKIYNLYPSISPYFIILLFWYPCFENLFSIIRKLIIKKNPLEPDNQHLHHHLFLFLKNKFKLGSLLCNNFTSIIINLFNLFIFYVASLNAYLTILQLIMIFASIIFYIVSYYFLRKANLNFYS